MEAVINILSGLFKNIFFMFTQMAPYLFIGLFFVGILHLFITKQFVVKHLGTASLWSVVKASILGVPLPLCSCGVIPTAVFMHKNGAKRASIISFLISTPQTGVDSITATYGVLGPVFAIFRPFAAFFMGVTGGCFIHFLEKKSKIKGDIDIEIDGGSCQGELALEKSNFVGKIKKFIHYAFKEFLDDISLHFGIGIVLAGIISFALPDNFADILGSGSNLWAMFIVVVVGVPMYICATSSIPIALALILKGFSPGVAFVFLAVGPATNAATIAVLQNVLGKRMTVFYLFALIILAVLCGFALDAIYQGFDIPSPAEMMGHGGHHIISKEVGSILSAILLFLLIMSYTRKIKRRFFMGSSIKGQVIHVSGMSCNHCVANVKSAIEKVEGVEIIEINLDKGEVRLTGNFDIEAVKKAVIDVGYSVD